ncbi:MAG: hypothetical protein ACJAYY_000499, partial [Paraglaciecola sp.]
TVTVSQSVLTSGSETITLDTAYLTSDTTCTTVVGDDYDQTYCNAPAAEDISATSAQVGTDVVFTIIAPVGVTVGYTTSFESGTGVHGDTVTFLDAGLTPADYSIELTKAYLVLDTSCETIFSKTFTETVPCPTIDSNDFFASSIMIGNDLIFTIATAADSQVDVSLPDNTTTRYSNGDTFTLLGASNAPGVYSIVLENSVLITNSTCQVALNKTFTDTLLAPPNAVNDAYSLTQGSSREIRPLQRGDDDSDPNSLSIRIKDMNDVAITGGIQSFAVPNGMINIEADGAIMITPDITFYGLITFPYTIINSENRFDVGIVTVTVDPFPNQPTTPTAVDDSYTMDQGETITIRPLTKGTNDSDPNNLELSIYSIAGIEVNDIGSQQTINVSENGSLVGAVLIETDGEIKFTPIASQSGTITFPYVIQNTHGDSDTANQIIEVNAIPGVVVGAPTAVDDSYTMDQGETITIRPLNKGTDDSDPNNLELSLYAIAGIEVNDNGSQQTIVVIVDFTTVGVVRIETDGEITFTPEVGQSGTIIFPYTIQNTNGHTDTANQIIEVNAIPGGGTAAPTAVDDSYTMDQGETITIRPLDKGTDDSDPNNLDLSVYSIAGEEVTYNALPQTINFIAATTTRGVIKIETDGEITFTPEVGVSGTITFPYVIKNTNGDSDTANQIIEVNAIPGGGSAAPSAVDDSYTMDQGETITIRPLTKGVNDSDPNNLELSVYSIAGEEVTYNALPQTINFIAATTTLGVIKIETDGEITFTPEVGVSGTITFPYVIKNTNGDSDTANQIIEVNAIPGGGSAAPTAVDDSYTMNQAETITIRPLTKGTNDSDPNNLDLSVYAIAGEEVTYNALPQTINVIAASATLGVVRIEADGEITFTPAVGQSGTITFPYIIQNTNGDSDTANQIIEVDQGEFTTTSAKAVDDTYTTYKDDAIIIYPLTRGINDSAPSGGSLTITRIAGEEVTYNALPQTIPLQQGALIVGSIIINTANNIEFIPALSYLGEVLFSYEISDGNETDTATTKIAVKEFSFKTSFQDSALENNFEFYPNPSKGNVIIFLKSSSAGDVRVTLSDVTGKIIYAGAARLKEGQNELDFNFNVNPGVLLLNIRNEQVNYGTSKIIFR